MHLFASHFGTYEVARDARGEPVLRPFRHDPRPSHVGLRYLELAQSAARITAPMVRRSWLEQGALACDRRLRGREEFVAVDWPTVSRRIADEIIRVRERHGNQAIFGGSYGWASAGRFHHAQSQLKRLLSLAGGFTSSVNTYSYGAAAVLLPHVLGKEYQDACATAPSWSDIAGHCRLLVSFGGLRLSNAQVEAGGTGAHRVAPWLDGARANGMRLVMISPSGRDAPPGGQVEHIPLRPNTDAAVMLALAHTLLTEGRADRAFIALCCVGFAEFEAYLLGRDDGVVKDVVWGEAISGVSRDRLYRLAHELAGQPCLINVAWSLQRARYGEQSYWAAIALACMTGGVGRPGCGFSFGLGAVNSVGQPVRSLRGPAVDQGVNPVRRVIPVARLTELLENPGGTLRYNGTTLPLPDIRLIWWAGGNPFHHHQDLHRLARAWQRPETIIVSEQVWTATARMADIVLPAALPFERDDLAASSRDNWLIYSRKVSAPPPQVLTDHQALTRVAQCLGIADAFTAGLSEAQWIERLYQGYRQRFPELPDWRTFRQRGFAVLDEGEDAPHPADHFRRFAADPQAHPLGTPSGKIEIVSRRLQAFGHEDLGAFPHWRAPEEWLLAPLTAQYPLHLLSPQPATRLHSQLDAVGESARARRRGYEVASLSPRDAARENVAEGDIVELYNARGRVRVSAHIDDQLMPGVVVLPTGAGFRLDEQGCDVGGNPNTLTAILPASSFSQAAAPNSCLVALKRCDQRSVV
ncbi:molybdopterin-dependent oxidoreductase [Brenneria tiliae]|uniref:molybdopterin-dependent oxidoreductase n=1 Tax=Brenneria tiliae TaxID=2914984 RepID=UPI002014D7CD|nr:molybdopterin-dependent oxidoreductase [Brenneria tiliae]MCL2896886.1 molybdopterin-dependent oxidoreductase [Brenneria tiliae]MCL2901444.1 molybdopterin-dependent oxidoreductase [Brenneria tiliae]